MAITAINVINIEIIDLARDNHIAIIVVPSHSTHKLQPLDKTYMGVLKAYYSEEIRVWCPLSAFNISNFFESAHLKFKIKKTDVIGVLQEITILKK